ncbi:hypothetical protein M8J75_016198 [Diaphorina citri]|nr:hypothetical protein M8J75_016198 [Diaphorina citri]
MSGLTLNLNLDTPDRINALFPKCRPRTSAPPSYLSATDINLNQISSTTSSPDNINTLMMDSTPDRSCDNNGGGGGGDDSHDSHDDESSVEESTGDEDEESPGSNLVLQLKNPTATTYKLRDSRIIEIAGGREVYCQSRSKSSRSKSGNHGGEPKKQQPLQQDGTSSEVTETVFSNEVSSVKHQRQQNSADEGCVVFDDIGGDEWGRRPSRQRSGGPLSSGGSSPSPPLHHYPFHFSSNHPLFFKQQQDSQVPKHSGGESRGGGGGSEASLSSDSKHSTAGSANQKVLGSPLPIAQYEGSPRRYGNANKLTEPPVLPSLLSSPSVYLPKPGFPQRILDEDSSGCTPGVSSSHQAPATISTGSISPPPGQGPGFDYLYEFSETRKVLEEFFKPGDNVNNINNSGTNSHQFRDLEYELRRQNSLELDKKGGVEKRGGGGRGSSYVGLRLASDELCGDRSPRKPSQDSTSDNNKERDLLSGFSVSTEMLPQNSAASVTSASGLYHHHHHRHNSREPSSRSGGGTGSRAPYPGGTHQVPSRRSSPQSESEILSLGKSRNFTLSPETTDCESNCGDLDSEISSLVLVMDEVGGVGGSGGGGGGLTILPLHQGERPYPGMPVLLMKRQISEIEQEIVVQRSHHSKLEEEVNGITGAGTTSEQALSGCPSTCTTTTTPSPLNTGGGGSNKKDILDPGDIDLTSLDPLNGSCSGEGRDGVGGTLDDPPRDDPPRSPPPPAPTTHRSPPPPASTTHRSDVETSLKDIRVEAALKDIRLTLQRTKTLPIRPPPQLSPPLSSSSLIATASPGGMGSDEQESAPVWVPRKPGGSGPSADEDDADTDLETDRLLGQQRTNDEGYFDDKMVSYPPGCYPHLTLSLFYLSHSPLSE